MCKGYITEKFWGALQTKNIPVVMNSADMARVAPQRMSINIKDFDSPKVNTGSNITIM